MAGRALNRVFRGHQGFAPSGCLSIRILIYLKASSRPCELLSSLELRLRGVDPMPTRAEITPAPPPSLLDAEDKTQAAMSRLKALSSAECLALKAVMLPRAQQSRLICRDCHRGHYRSFSACSNCALHQWTFAGRARACLFGLGNAPCLLAGQAIAARRQGDAESRPVHKLRLSLRDGGRQGGPLHRAAAARQALRRRRVAEMALQLHLSVVLAQSAMVAQRHDRPARDLEAARGHGRIRRRARSSTWCRRPTFR